MTIADIDQHRGRTLKSHPSTERELSPAASLGLCLLAAILLAVAGWIAFEIFLTLVTLD